MRSEKQKAVTSAEVTTQQQDFQTELYPKSASASSTKLQIGTLLLALQTSLNRKQREKGWQLFGVMLRQYVEYGRVG